MREEPITADFSMKVGCPNMCEYCPQKLLIKKYCSNMVILRLEDFKKFLSKIPINVDIAFSGVSEPFLNPDCIEMMEYANERGYSIRLNTTMRDLKIKDIPKLEDLPFLRVVVHLVDDKNLMTIKVDDNYMKILKAVHKSKIKNLNFLALGKLHSRIQNEMNAFPTIFRYTDTRSSSIFEYANNIAISGKAGNTTHLDLVLPKFKKGRIICAEDPNLTSHTLLPNGDVMLCNMDYGLKHIVGNINNQDWNGINNGETIKKIKKSWIKESNRNNSLCRMCENSENYYKYKIRKFIKEPIVKLLIFLKLRRLAVKIKTRFKKNLKKYK